MRILKRNTPSQSPNMQRTGSSSSTASGGMQKTLAEREAEYNAARARIFGANENSDNTTSGNGGKVNGNKESRGSQSRDDSGFVRKGGDKVGLPDNMDSTSKEASNGTRRSTQPSYFPEKGSNTNNNSTRSPTGLPQKPN